MTLLSDCHRRHRNYRRSTSPMNNRGMRQAQAARTHRVRLLRIQIAAAFRRAPSSPAWDRQEREMSRLRSHRIRMHRAGPCRLRVHLSPMAQRKNLADSGQALPPTQVSHRSWSHPFHRPIPKQRASPTRQQRLNLPRKLCPRSANHELVRSARQGRQLKLHRNRR